MEDSTRDGVHGLEAASPETAKLMRRATYAAVAVAAFLIIIKFVAWMLTGSVAMMSTLLDSFLDAAASLVNLWAVHHALQPADREHRFGHGKAEPLAGLGQAAFIAGSGLLLIVEAAQRFVKPEAVTKGEIGIAVMVVSIIATLGLVRYQKMVVAKTDSVAINADSLHYTGDLLINGSVIISLLLATVGGWDYADPLFAIGIAGFLIYNAWGILEGSLHLLMDRELPDDDRQRIITICKSHPEVRNMHDLRTRSAGLHAFIQLHLELDPALTLVQAHRISDEVEDSIRDVFPNAEVIIHQDPAGIREVRQPNSA